VKPESSPILICAITASLLLCSLLQCKGKVSPREEIPVSAVLLFVIGDVRSDGKVLKPGDIVPAGKNIETGPNSSCDLQLKGPEAGVAIRMQALSRMSVRAFKAGDTKTYRGVLDQGTALFKVEKLRAKENIEAEAPTAVAGVRGTGFLFSFVAETVSASVQEGKLSMRPALSLIESQTGGVLGQSRVLSTMYDTMQQDSVNVEPGQSASWTRADIDLRYEAASSVVDMIARANPESDNAQLLKSIDERFRETKYGPPRPMAQPQNLQGAALNLLGQKLLGLSPVETRLLNDAVSIGQAIANRNQANQADLLGHMSEVRQQRPETLLLRNGSKATGLIYEQGGAYIVETPMGTQAYPRGMVEGYAF
jgi:hypothetical protein